MPPSPLSAPAAPRIVVLDGFTLTPNEANRLIDDAEPRWDGLCELGQVEVFARTADQQIAERAAGAQAVLTNKTPLSRAVIEALPELRYIGVLATGVNVVDLAAARDKGITVTNVPGYSGDSVAQHVFALLLHFASGIAAHDDAVHDGEWVRSDDFAFTVQPLVELSGKRLGIVGMGEIGQRVAAIGHAFGMHIVAQSRTPKDLPYPVEWVDLDTLFATSDAITLHCPLTDATRGLVNAARLAKMKPTAYLINTGRGPLIDEAALAAALNEERIAGAGLDVLSAEPPPADNPLLHAKRCVITPHIAWATRESRQRLMATATRNLAAFLGGQPQNVVS